MFFKKRTPKPATSDSDSVTSTQDTTTAPVEATSLVADVAPVKQPAEEVTIPEATPPATIAPSADMPPIKQVAQSETPDTDAEPSGGWFSRLKKGLSKSSTKVAESIGGIFTQRKLDDELLEELEDALVMADIGVETAARLVETLRSQKFDKDVTEQEVREHFATQMADILAPAAVPLAIDTNHRPYIITMVGVNGTGKTTTIGKLAKQFQQQGHKVMLAAGDTFRAAAVEQLVVWGERNDCAVVTGEEGGDAASVAYRAVEQAKQQDVDVLLVDTAGRLQNKSGLMQELQKIHRVIAKQDDTAPHATLLVLDATTGQNAHSQVEIFKEMVNVSGLIITKLDGSAKGGVVVALADRFHLPVHAIGVGEGIDDLQPFDPTMFACSLMGL